MRRLRPLAAAGCAAAATAALAACWPLAPSPSAAVRPSPRVTAARTSSPTPGPTAAATQGLVGQPTPAAPKPPVPVQLSLTGSLAGTVSSARPVSCGANGGAYGLLIAFDLAGRTYELDVTILDYHGPGPYAIPPERVSLHTTGEGAPVLLAGTSGQVTIAADQRSGSVDAQLQGDTEADHVTGTFRC